jgi:hypothetical protein
VSLLLWFSVPEPALGQVWLGGLSGQRGRNRVSRDTKRHDHVAYCHAGRLHAPTPGTRPALRITLRVGAAYLSEQRDVVIEPWGGVERSLVRLNLWACYYYATSCAQPSAQTLQRLCTTASTKALT